VKVRVLSPALEEIADAALWFDSQRAGLGDEFWRSVDAMLSRIEAAPLGFARSEFATAELDIRFALVRRFNYVIHFLVETDEVAIISVAHGARRPRLLAASHPLLSATLEVSRNQRPLTETFGQPRGSVRRTATTAAGHNAAAVPEASSFLFAAIACTALAAAHWTRKKWHRRQAAVLAGQSTCKRGAALDHTQVQPV
jgi:hypothetical protein